MQIVPERKKQSLTSLTTDGGPTSPACTVLWMPLSAASCQQQMMLSTFTALSRWILHSDWSEELYNSGSNSSAYINKARCLSINKEVT